MNRRLRVLALTGLVALGAAVRATLTVTPASHDFGAVAVGGFAFQSFQVVLPAAWSPKEALHWTVAGPDAGDFGVEGFVSGGHIQRAAAGHCTKEPQRTVCDHDVFFRPNSIGPKQAKLIVVDSLGNQGMAQLVGKGVSPVCTNQVVFCNYAHLYSGTFGWTSTLNAPESQYKVTVQVDITNGVAVCNGSATSTDHGQSLSAGITGKGLIAVEWLPDPTYPWVYQITAACPTPDWPPGPNGEAATPSQPAELGHNDYSTYKQSDPRIKPGWTLEDAVAGLARLQGSLSYPAPETDQLNGVSGAVVVSWNLVRS